MTTIAQPPEATERASIWDTATVEEMLDWLRPWRVSVSWNPISCCWYAACTIDGYYIQNGSYNATIAVRRLAVAAEARVAR